MKAKKKEEEEEEEEKRDSRLVKDWLKKQKYSRLLLERFFCKCKTKPCFYRLFMSGQEGHSEEL